MDDKLFTSTRHRLSATDVGVIARHRSCSVIGVDAMEISSEIELLKELRKLRSLSDSNNATGISQYIFDNSTTISCQHLQKINEIIYLSPDTFLIDFVNNDGLTNLCSLAAIHFNRSEILESLLLIFDTILNFENIGFDLVLSHSHTIQCITDMFESSDKQIMSNVLQLLTTICLFDQNVNSFEIVIVALYSYGDRHNASSIFDEFVSKMFSENDLYFRRDALKFINVVLNLSPELRTRVDARRYLTELGFQNILNQLWDIVSATKNDLLSGNAKPESMNMRKYLQSVMDAKDISRTRMFESDCRELNDPLLQGIDQQLRMYGEMEQEDHNQMLWNGIDLDDPKELINYLFMKAVNQQQITQFIDTLIALCSIPHSKAQIWSTLPKLIMRVTRDQTDESFDDSDNIYDDVNELKLLLDELLNEAQIDKDYDLKQELKTLRAENDELKQKNIDLNRQKRKLDIDKKNITSIIKANKHRETLQNKLFAKYHEAQHSKPCTISSPTDMLMGAPAHQTLPAFTYPANLSVAATKSFPFVQPKKHNVTISNGNKQKKRHKKRKHKKIYNDDNTDLKLGPVPIIKQSSNDIISAAISKHGYSVTPSTQGLILKSTPKSAPIPSKATPTPAPLPCAPLPTAQKAAPMPCPLPDSILSAPLPAPIPNTAPLPMAPAPLPNAAPAPIPNAPMPCPLPPMAFAAAAPPPLPVLANANGMVLPPLCALPNLLNIRSSSKKVKHPEYLSKPRRKMKPFQWEQIKTAQPNTVWSEIALKKEHVTLKTNMDKNDDTKHGHDDEKEVVTIELNIDYLEELFGKKKKENKPANVKKRKQAKETLLDAKRSYNMHIALSRLKISHKVLKTAILALSEETLDSDDIGKLQKLVPTNEEQELLKSWSGSDPKNLALAERFVYELKDVSCIAERLEFWRFKIHFKDAITEQKCKINLLEIVYNTIKFNESFKMFLQYILLIGNYMNYQHPRKGNAFGFELKSLLTLESAKSINKKETLLTFIIKQCKNNNNSECLQFVNIFCKDLGAVLDAFKSEKDKNKIDIKQLATKIAEFGTMRKKLEIKIKELKNDNDEDMFEVVMSEFLSETKKTYMDLVDKHTKIINELIELSKYLGCEKGDAKLVFIEILLEFSMTLKYKHQEINMIEERQNKAMLKALQKSARKKPKLKNRSKKSKESKKEKAVKERTKNDKLLALYQQRKKMVIPKGRRSDSISIDTKFGEESESELTADMLKPPSLTAEMLEYVTSDEIKKRREKRKRMERDNTINIQSEMKQLKVPLYRSPSLLRRSPSSFRILTPKQSK